MDSSVAELVATSTEQRLVLEQGPLAAPRCLRRLAPFAGLLSCMLVSLALDSKANRLTFVILGAASALGMIAAALIPWQRLPRGAQAAAGILPLFVAAVLVHVDNGLTSQILVMMLAPLFWLALYEPHRYLSTGLMVTTAAVSAELIRLPSFDDAMRAVLLLAVALTLMPAVARLVATNRAALVAITDISGRDTLTGLANRRGVTTWLDQARNDHSHGLGLIFIDLDRFKQINDTFGHDAGDDLLVDVAQRMSGAVRAGDVVARVGGDEFIIASNASGPAVEDLADRVRHAIADTPFQIRGHAIALSASVGVSHMIHQPDDIGTLLDKADHAMYLSKRASRTHPAGATTVDKAPPQ